MPDEIRAAVPGEWTCVEDHCSSAGTPVARPHCPLCGSATVVVPPDDVDLAAAGSAHAGRDAASRLESRAVVRVRTAGVIVLAAVFVAIGALLFADRGGGRTAGAFGGVGLGLVVLAVRYLRGTVRWRD